MNLDIIGTTYVYAIVGFMVIFYFWKYIRIHTYRELSYFLPSLGVYWEMCVVRATNAYLCTDFVVSSIVGNIVATVPIFVQYMDVC